MSANTLLRNTKIREELLPAVQTSTTFVPRTGGGDAKVGLDVPGYVGGGLKAREGSGVLTLMTGTSLDPGTAKTALTGYNSGAVALGDATNSGKGNALIAGSLGLSPIYNRFYDPVCENVSTQVISGSLTGDRTYTSFDVGNPGYYGFYVTLITGAGLSIPANSYITFGLYLVDSHSYIWKQTVKASDLIGPDNRTQAPQFQFGGFPKYLTPAGKDAYALGFQSSDGAGNTTTWNLGSGGECQIGLFSLG